MPTLYDEPVSVPWREWVDVGVVMSHTEVWASAPSMEKAVVEVVLGLKTT